MRRVALFAAVGLTSMAVGSAVAADVDQGLDIRLSPNLPQKKGAAVKKFKLFVETTTKINNKEEQFATKRAVIFFDKNLVFAKSNYPSCSKTQIAQDDSKCPAASRVGKGTASAEAVGQTQDDLVIKAYDGPGATKFFLKIEGNEPLKIDSVLDASLKTASGKFGKKLEVIIPNNLQQPLTGVFATLTRFTTTVFASAKGQSYVSLKSCPTTKKLSFKGDFFFTDGTNKSATDTIACRR